MERFPEQSSISKKAIKKIIYKVNDERLENRQGDYFVLHRKDKKTFIPKQETIRVKGGESFSYIPTEDYILSLLEEDD